MTNREYLETSGWYNIYDNKWTDLTLRCHYVEVHEDIALLIQKLRDLPWYKKLFNKIFI